VQQRLTARPPQLACTVTPAAAFVPSKYRTASYRSVTICTATSPGCPARSAILSHRACVRPTAGDRPAQRFERLHHLVIQHSARRQDAPFAVTDNAIAMGNVRNSGLSAGEHGISGEGKLSSCVEPKTGRATAIQMPGLRHTPSSVTSLTQFA
jgi:hypothetical protein